MVIACIPVRYSSSRLRGKHFLSLEGKPILYYLIERAIRIPRIDAVYLCVGLDGHENRYNGFQLAFPKLRFIFGPLDNVLARFTAAIEDAERVNKKKVSAMVRITGDDCFPDMDRIGHLIGLREEHQLDMALFKHYIPGMDAEVYSKAMLEAVRDEGLGAKSEYLKDLAFHPCFKSDSLYCGYDSQNKLSLDRPEDFVFINRHVPKLWKENHFFGMEEANRYFENRFKPSRGVLNNG